ncbi:hypothetical protein FHU10_3555 [Serratia fonticola]|uniref:Uncharacterized protein n=1 Tax=Serratia fonticola TaxID=47917 RepID=A0A542BSF8_SERFO|nr:hypothetical protein FHU09_4151 [Serratia fonticola]TQI96454.1 hypothetical protein FHU11_1894 [Serratia fonticola]TVZ70951.1 hypothetical protein FHU10_3555 [Serratia fonticola]
MLFFLIEEPTITGWFAIKYSAQQSGSLACEDSTRSCSVKYFLMGVSFMLVAWVGTFMLMVA